LRGVSLDSDFEDYLDRREADYLDQSWSGVRWEVTRADWGRSWATCTAWRSDFRQLPAAAQAHRPFGRRRIMTPDLLGVGGEGGRTSSAANTQDRGQTGRASKPVCLRAGSVTLAKASRMVEECSLQACTRYPQSSPEPAYRHPVLSTGPHLGENRRVETRGNRVPGAVEGAGAWLKFLAHGAPPQLDASSPGSAADLCRTKAP